MQGKSLTNQKRAAIVEFRANAMQLIEEDLHTRCVCFSAVVDSENFLCMFPRNLDLSQIHWHTHHGVQKRLHPCGRGE